MPGFFRSLFKTSISRNRKRSPSGQVHRQGEVTHDQPIFAPGIGEEDIQALANRLRERLSTRDASSSSDEEVTSGRDGRDGNETVDRLLDLLVETGDHPLDTAYHPLPQDNRAPIQHINKTLPSSHNECEPLSSPGNPSPASSRSSSLLTSSESEPDPDFQKIGAGELEARFGTGAIPIPQPARLPALRPKTSSEVSLKEPDPDLEIWEYKGNKLTRSALSLVLRQERLAMADSSGQYTGEVSWDDLRNAWIPDWAEKLRPEDVADGELPNTNPAEFAVKRKDAWGNRIGWKDGQMFYHEEPTFVLRD